MRVLKKWHGVENNDKSHSPLDLYTDSILYVKNIVGIERVRAEIFFRKIAIT